MSGGSFNYLCHKDAEDIFRYQSDLNDMSDALSDYGCELAVKETDAIKSYVNEIMAKLEARLDKIRPVWKAMEWWRSGDWSEQDFLDAVRDFNNSHKGDQP